MAIFLLLPNYYLISRLKIGLFYANYANEEKVSFHYGRKLFYRYQDSKSKDVNPFPPFDWIFTYFMQIMLMREGCMTST